jgi:hypothetical protein
MKKLLITLTVLGILVGCTRDTFEIVEPITFVPESLEISSVSGLKLENVFTSNQVLMNVKLPKDGTYRLKIRGIDGTLLSQEKLTAKEGNNLLSTYTSALEKSSYTIELTDINHNTLGKLVFVKQ